MYEKAKRCAECPCLEPGESGYTCHFYGKMIDDIKKTFSVQHCMQANGRRKVTV